MGIYYQPYPQTLLDRDNLRLALAYFALILLAEFLAAFVNAELGLIAHFGLIGACLGHAILGAQRTTYPMLLSLSLVPLIRILSLTLPLAAFPRLYWYLLTGIPMIVAGFAAQRVLGYSLKDIGLRLTVEDLPLQGLIGLSGIVLGYVEYGALGAAPLAPLSDPMQLVLAAIILLIGTGFAEELIFRGVMQSAAIRALPGVGIIYVAAIFGILHIGNQSLSDVVIVFGIGMYFGLAVWKTNSIVGVTLAHGLTNLMLFVIMPNLHAIPLQ